MKRTFLLCGAMLILGILLTACAPSQGKRDTSPPAGSSSSSKEEMDPTLSPPADAGAESSGPEQDPAPGPDKGEPQTIQGIISRMGSYLVLLADDEYQVLDFGEDLSLEGFAEGDRVTVTYTGTLGDEAATPVVVAMEKLE